MTRYLKILGLGLTATLALSAVAVASASALAGGHFSSTVDKITLDGTEEGEHRTKLTAPGGFVECAETTYHGHETGAKVPGGTFQFTKATITPTYKGCYNTEDHSGEPNVTVNMNGCDYIFTVREAAVEEEHSTVHLSCPSENQIVIEAPGCTFTFGSQTTTGGVVYTTDIVDEKHALTIDVTVENITYEKHGLCIFLAPTGTGPHGHDLNDPEQHNNGNANLTGSVTVQGTDAEENPVDITATEALPYGHFSSTVERVTLDGTEKGEHGTALSAPGGLIECTEVTYHSVVEGEEVGSETYVASEATITPTYKGCYNTADHSGEPNVTVNMNGCDYIFTVRGTTVEELDSTVHLECEGAKKASVVAPGCTFTFGSQTTTGGVVYTTDVIDEKHALTVDVTVENITYEKHGLCIFLAPTGTGPHGHDLNDPEQHDNGGANLTGSVTVQGTDADENPVDITATGDHDAETKHDEETA